ncbi:MAG: hypothetical protein QGH94_01840 [Phycisphaerae bacterium]|jgi:hypothetical protein|nr:hypothetical protein [Phycisphaerae bacterium]MDP7286714.1 hypothetical protein [Phycisphaerae bacterium]
MKMRALLLAISCLVTLMAATAQAASPAGQMLIKNGVREVVFVERKFTGDGHWYANFAYNFAGPNSPMYTQDARLAKLDVASGKVTTLLKDKTGSIRDPKVHYDAKKILFSYRKGGVAQFHLYEINVDGTGLKQLTDGIYDDLEATYLPDGGIAFTSGRAKRWVNCWLVQVAVLYRCDGDGKNIRQLSANIEQDNTPWVLHDGRILFTRWEYVDRNQVSFHHLWTCNPDGTNQMVFFGNMHRGSVYIDAKSIPGTNRVVMLDSPGHGRREHEGRLATVTDQFGPDDKSAIKYIGNTNCRDPYAVSADCFIVAAGRSIKVVSGAGKAMDLHSSKITISEPRPIIKQKRQRVIPSRVDMSKAHGTLVLNNVYIGRNMEGIKKGEIKKLMVLETLPKPLNYGNGYHDFIPISHGGTFTLSRIVGTIPVEPDGSAHFELPANRPLFFIALDEKNRSVKRMHSFLSVMPGEVLSCVGCHEDRVKTPTIAVGRVVSAMKRAPSKLTPVPGVPYTIDFPKHIQPILDKHCVKCHSPEKPKGRVILSGDRGPIYSYSFMTLTTTGFVSDGRNGSGNSKPRGVGDSASPLMKMLDGSHHKAKLSADEIAMIRNWIHIGAPYPGTYAALYTGMLRNNTVTKEYRDSGKAAEAAFKKSCSKCHKTRIPKPERNSIAGNKNRKTFFWDSHMAWNLSRPEKSPLLLAPLSVKAGGLGTCKARDKSPAQAQAAKLLFTDTKNADYQALLKMATEAKVCLAKNRRWDMPEFKPHPYYIREMKRYGILSEAFDIDRDKIDVFKIDRRYWESFWYYPKGDGPKLYANKKMHSMLISPKNDVPWAKDLTQLK